MRQATEIINTISFLFIMNNIKNHALLTPSAWRGERETVRVVFPVE
ncbi:hypothetical protein HMPREF9441_02205 [Paraprevotella clara YIT 11840]|uniref:Uncharacterized protein n=1 Tax=Paraprevotella clara YIT 11840 TaxID=762968 RepID=G5SS56_9BACT|nr:hypothetical protein HMPREF9441_02205 [Paraprevotella clara YIT 11840]